MFDLWYNILVIGNDGAYGCNFSCPLVHKGVMPMDISVGLQFILVIIAILTYFDSRYDKKKR